MRATLTAFAALAGTILAVLFVLAILTMPVPAHATFLPIEGTCDMTGRDCCLPDREEIDPDFMLPPDSVLMETICRGNPGGASGAAYASQPIGGWATAAFQGGGPIGGGAAGGAAVASFPGSGFPIYPLAAVPLRDAGAGWPGLVLAGMILLAVLWRWRLPRIVLLAGSLAGCAACYREDRNADGSWPGYCADRFDSPNPTKKAR